MQLFGTLAFVSNETFLSCHTLLTLWPSQNVFGCQLIKFLYLLDFRVPDLYYAFQNHLFPDDYSFYLLVAYD